MGKCGGWGGRFRHTCRGGGAAARSGAGSGAGMAGKGRAPSGTGSRGGGAPPGALCRPGGGCSSASPRDVSFALAREWWWWWWWGSSALLILFPSHLLRNGLRLGISQRAPSERRKGRAPSARRGRGTPGGSGAAGLEPSAQPSPLVLFLPLPFHLCRACLPRSWSRLVRPA